MAVHVVIEVVMVFVTLVGSLIATERAIMVLPCLLTQLTVREFVEVQVSRIVVVLATIPIRHNLPISEDAMVFATVAKVWIAQEFVEGQPIRIAEGIAFRQPVKASLRMFLDC